MHVSAGGNRDQSLRNRAKFFVRREQWLNLINWASVLKSSGRDSDFLPGIVSSSSFEFFDREKE